MKGREGWNFLRHDALAPHRRELFIWTHKSQELETWKGNSRAKPYNIFQRETNSLTTLNVTVSSSQKSICSHLFLVSATPLSPTAPRPHHQELVAGILMEEPDQGTSSPSPNHYIFVPNILQNFFPGTSSTNEMWNGMVASEEVSSPSRV